MATHITILGSGTCVPSLERNPCAFLVNTDNQRLLFECGPGTMRRLLETGISIFDISHLFVSHFHPDHIGELASFLFALKYPAPAGQKQPLTVVAGKGFQTHYDRLKTVFGHWIAFAPDLLKIVELATDRPDGLRLPGFSVASMPVAHRPESLAYRLTDRRGKVLVYSGDSDECDGLVAIAAGADLMICESAFPDDQKVPGHLTPSLAGRIAQSAAVKRLVLTHFYPACDAADIENQCRSAYSGPIVLARDLLTLTL